MTRPVASRELVARRCEAARAAGIAEGMDLAHARSLLAEGVALHSELHRPDRDAAALRGLACWALRYSPLVAPDGPDGLLIDITGTERVHRGEVRLIRAAASEIHRLGFAVRVAAASTFGCAWGVARFGAHDLSRVPPGREREALRGLPAAALRIDERTLQGLGEVGIITVGHVLDLPRASLAARFDGSLLLGVLRAIGEAPEAIDPVRPSPPARCEMMFDGPTGHWESVEAAARRVLGELAGELAQRERGLRRLDVELLRPRAAPTPIRIDLSRPSRAAKHLWSLLRARLERVDLGDGVEGVVLTASRTARLRHEQRGSEALGADDARATEAAWGELVDTLAGRLGADQVVRIEPVESHLPERAFRERSAMEAMQRGPARAVTRAARPTVLFRRPERADAMAVTPDGPILSLGWRGRRWKVVSCIGPERIGQEWWRWEPPAGDGEGEAAGRRSRVRRGGTAAPPGRDYFIVQTEGGRWLWVCRHVGTGRWFVHGEWS
ncbi:MAG: DNA polymerase Y family protein [Phycisphaerales bacterium]|nr:DNA polymerase Y family protein [Phycisphaerales bacterium]